MIENVINMKKDRADERGKQDKESDKDIFKKVVTVFRFLNFFKMNSDTFEPATPAQ